MFKKLMLTALAAGLALGPLPARAASSFDSANAQVEQAASGEGIAALDKEKPSKPKKEEKKKKKFDDFKDANGNGIDDRYERTENPKRKQKGEPGEVNF